MEERELIIAVDFDGTLCDHAFPEIGKPRVGLIEYLKRLKKEGGYKYILWTCRSGTYLQDAVQWCERQGLYFDAVNENIKGTFPGWPKIYYDYLIDDRNLPHDVAVLEQIHLRRV